MRRIGRTLAGTVGILLLIAYAASLSGSRADEALIHHAGVDDRPTPPSRPRPIEIQLGLSIIDFAADQRSGGILRRSRIPGSHVVRRAHEPLAVPLRKRHSQPMVQDQSIGTHLDAKTNF